jgi:AcrR family transcriptional regulator
MTIRKQRLNPRKQPVQIRSRATVDAILIAAAQVFEAHGYAAGTTNRIASKAGVSIGTLYQYFPSKEAIAVALLEQHISETGHRLHEWVGHMVVEQHGLSEALHDYVTEMMHIHSMQPRLQHMLLEEIPLPERVHQALLESERNAAKTMAGLLRLFPEARQGVPEHTCFVIVQTVESLTHRFAVHPDDQFIPRTTFVDEIVAMLVAYLTYEALPQNAS